MNWKPLIEHAETKPLSGLLAKTYFAYAEVAHRHGKVRGKNMILESREYGENLVQNHAPWLIDDAGDDD